MSLDPDGLGRQLLCTMPDDTSLINQLDGYCRPEISGKAILTHDYCEGSLSDGSASASMKQVILIHV